jgi:tRNA U55 pseudouridine synthase TruB
MIILNKPPGITMNTFIDNYKLQHNITEKVCYSGRLDPMARGMIMLLVGDECKMMDIYNKKNK